MPNSPVIRHASDLINRIFHRSSMQTEKSQPECKQIMPETRFTEFAALSVDPSVWILRSASETDERFYEIAHLSSGLHRRTMFDISLNNCQKNRNFITIFLAVLLFFLN